MFAALTLERDPLKLENIPLAIRFWIQDAGVFAALGLVAFILFAFARRRRLTEWTRSRLARSVFLVALVGAAVSYTMLGILLLQLTLSASENPLTVSLTGFGAAAYGLLLSVAPAFALIAVGVPFVEGLSRLRFGRIWALARLSFKEALRRRVLWAFAFLLVVFLFAGWFIPSKAEDQVRTYVSVVTTVSTFLLLLTAALLASFSIPADIRQQTIHTILTKPVERFEIVLGRFLGYVALMTLILVVATGLSLLYVLRGIDPDAQEESLKARVPVFGELHFENTPDPRMGENIGREWQYRGYITGPNPPNPPQFAVWEFTSLPGRLVDRDTVRCEFTFDVFRTVKGRDDTPIFCTLAFETWRFRGRNTAYNNERNQLRQTPGAESLEKIDAALAEKYGYYEAASIPIVDYHTRFIDLPVGLFRNALEDDKQLRQELESGGQVVVPLRVQARCEDRSQYIGMAKYDLYIRADDHAAGADRLWFSWNFFKGGAGLWFYICLVVGLAVALSTYLTGVISFLCTAFLCIAGLFQEFIANIASGNVVGGGPMESMIRLVKGAGMITPLEDTATVRVATGSDYVFRWVLRGLLDVLPDTDRFGLSDYVAEGFDISAGLLLVNLIILIGYLLPWAVLAYYLIRAREVASSS